MAQVDIIRSSYETSFSDIQNLVTGVHYAPAQSEQNACFPPDESCLPTPPPEYEATESASSIPEVIVDGLPALHAGYPNEVSRARILQSALDAQMNEPDAEKAFFVADLSSVYKQLLRFKRCLPGVEPFYAVKCNPDPYVLRLLAALGTGFDCASHGEIQQVLQIGGIDPSRIIFANPCKSSSFVRHAAKAGVDMMTFDNTDELYKIAKNHPSAKLVVRILTDDSKSLCRLGLKFGAPLVTVPGLLAKARELNLDVIGVSFHVGSGNYDPNAYSDAIMRARAAFDMGLVAGYTFNFLDVGGGFESADFDRAAAVLAKAIDEYFPKRVEQGIRVIAEPGRYFVASAFQLAANVIARRVTTAPDAEISADQPSVMYYINDGVYGAFNCIMFDHQTVKPYPLTLGRSPVSPSTHIHPSEMRNASVWGPTCDSIDCVSPFWPLPAQLEVGDWLGFDDMGAYTNCAASRFNGFDVSLVHYTTGVGAESRAVRKALSVFAV